MLLSKAEEVYPNLRKNFRNEAVVVKSLSTSETYQNLLKALKEKVRSSQLRAAVVVNQELIGLYWEIGVAVFKRQKEEGWGAKTIQRLAEDLQNTFPEMKGLSLRNIQFMVQFANQYPNFEIVKQLVSQIPWGHNILIMQRIGSEQERIWYIQKTLENGWSRSVLETMISSKLYMREGKAVHNFKVTLPPHQSDLAIQTLKDPYCFDFLMLRDNFDELELEKGLIDHIQKFLIELGAGFSFVGRQVHLDVGGQDFYLDLLFYHLKLRCYIVVELKAKEFKPEFAGKMNFYLSAVDDKLKHAEDNPTIGLLLCKTKNEIIAEYALRDIKKPIGISEYETQLIESLPEKFKGSLPTIEEIQLEFASWSL